MCNDGVTSAAFVRDLSNKRVMIRSGLEPDSYPAAPPVRDGQNMIESKNELRGLFRRPQPSREFAGISGEIISM